MHTGTSSSKRPISFTESSNPREFQINQLRRRYRPIETTHDSGITLSFGMAPSDPDFPFDLERLNCALHVPLTYPSGGRPSLNVANPEIGAVFEENVSRGFDDIVDSSLRMNGRGTLLNWINSLDRNLERLLTTTERAPMLKFIQNAGSTETNERLVSNMKSMALSQQIEQKSEPSKPSFAEVRPVYTAGEKVQAEKRRAVETKQLEARLGRLPLFQKAKDGLSFVIPIQPTKVDRLPVPLRPVKTVKLSVPSLYPLEPGSIELQGVHGLETRAVEIGFSRWFKNHSQLNLVSQINYLASNIHNFAKTVVEPTEPKHTEPETPAPVLEEPQFSTGGTSAIDADKPHLHVVQRPPEWTTQGNSDSGETDSSTTEEDYTDDEEDGGAPVPDLPEPTTEHGIALSFPSLELYGIELLDLVGLYITIKCDRCKETLDVANIPQTKDSSGILSPKVEACRKCSNSMSIGMKLSRGN